jgi:hypothetical protein
MQWDRVMKARRPLPAIHPRIAIRQVRRRRQIKVIRAITERGRQARPGVRLKMYLRFSLSGDADGLAANLPSLT